MAWYGRDYEDRGMRGAGFDGPYNRGTRRGYRDFSREGGWRGRGMGYDRELHPGERMVVRPGMERDRGWMGDRGGRDLGDRLREGWHDLKRGVRDVFHDDDERRYGARDRGLRYDRDLYGHREYRGYNRGMW